jgi:hypothetical protein
MRLTIAIWIGLCACGSTSKSTRVGDADETMLADCKIIQRVNGSGADANAAKDDARKKAAALGATQIRWIVPCCTTVEGDAYRCDLPK